MQRPTSNVFEFLLGVGCSAVFVAGQQCGWLESLDVAFALSSDRELAFLMSTSVDIGDVVALACKAITH